jgi:hypothetical protein
MYFTAKTVNCFVTYKNYSNKQADLDTITALAVITKTEWATSDAITPLQFRRHKDRN